MEPSLHMLEYDAILQKLADFTHTRAARERALALRPLQDLMQIRLRADQIDQACRMLDAATPPLSSLEGAEAALPLLALGVILSPEQLQNLGSFLSLCRRMQLYLERMASAAPALSAYGLSLAPLPDLLHEVERCLRGSEVDDRASPALHALRRQRAAAQERMRGKLESLLRTHPDWFMEGYVTERSGRLVLPLKRERRRDLPGTVVDASASGSTLFVEPASVSALREEAALLLIQEENEVQRILATLTAAFAAEVPALRQNAEVLTELDFLFACASLSRGMGGVPARVEPGRALRLRGARHPLLPRDSCVPLDIFLGLAPAETGVVVTGPNTGGKTVSLKTVGLLCLLAQTGLHVPCEEGLFPLVDHVLCDLGDGQSIAQNLSTFSAHVQRWVEILRLCTDRSLVLLDELGSGTDPQEGMALATAMLEALAARGALLLATTHYPEIKSFAEETPGFLNASMAFDPETLSPLYRLELGKPGESCALLIARRLGLEPGVLARAAELCAAPTLGPRPASRPHPASGPLPAPGPHPAPGPRPAEAAARPGAPVAFPEAPAPAPAAPAAETPKKRAFAVGDSVYVHPLHRTGIVAQPANAKGEVVVKVADRRYTVNQKRLSPHLKKEQLYPDAENYDLSIVLDTVENRKAKNKMRKRHVEGAVVTVPGAPEERL